MAPVTPGDVAPSLPSGGKLRYRNAPSAASGVRDSIAIRTCRGLRMTTERG
jgi:hypothetical protein